MNRRLLGDIIVIIALIALVVVVASVARWRTLNDQAEKTRSHSCEIRTENYSIVTGQQVRIQWQFSKGTKAYEVTGNFITGVYGDYDHGGYGEVESGGQFVTFYEPGTYTYTATGHRADSSTETCSMAVTVSQAHDSPPRNITPVNFSNLLKNTYTLRAGEAITFVGKEKRYPADENEYLIHVFAITGDSVAISLGTINTQNAEELVLRRNEEGSFLGCPGFYVTPTAISNDTVTISVKSKMCFDW